MAQNDFFGGEGEIFSSQGCICFKIISCLFYNLVFKLALIICQEQYECTEYFHPLRAPRNDGQAFIKVHSITKIVTKLFMAVFYDRIGDKSRGETSHGANIQGLQK